MKKLEEELKKTKEALEKEEKLRKQLEEQNVKVLQEKNDLFLQLEGERGAMGETEERQSRLLAQKNDLESQVSVSKIFSVMKNCYALLGRCPIMGRALIWRTDDFYAAFACSLRVRQCSMNAPC